MGPRSLEGTVGLPLLTDCSASYSGSSQRGKRKCPQPSGRASWPFRLQPYSSLRRQGGKASRGPRRDQDKPQRCPRTAQPARWAAVLKAASFCVCPGTVRGESGFPWTGICFANLGQGGRVDPPRLKVRETVRLLHGCPLLERPSLPETASREAKEKEGRIPGNRVLLTCQQPPSTGRACPASPCPLCTD